MREGVASGCWGCRGGFYHGKSGEGGGGGGGGGGGAGGGGGEIGEGRKKVGIIMPVIVMEEIGVQDTGILLHCTVV